MNYISVILRRIPHPYVTYVHVDSKHFVICCFGPSVLHSPAECIEEEAVQAIMNLDERPGLKFPHLGST